MSDISYARLTDEIERKLYKKHEDLLRRHPEILPKYDGCYNIAALCGDEVVGVATLEPQQWTPPLDMYNDAFIGWIDVDERFRRQGIARHMVGMLEEWAKKNGYRQIRAWSNCNAVEALHMWYALDYAMCPAKEPIFNEEGQVAFVVDGYKYAKILNPTSDKE